MLPRIFERTDSTTVIPISRAPRLLALDFTKGALVLLMVIYHWLNYFTSHADYIHRYLRFITPSFIFLTGFLISNVHLSKSYALDPRFHNRLVKRGAKLLALFVLLNLIKSLLLHHFRIVDMLDEQFSRGNMLAVYVTGNIFLTEHNKLASFYILVPIGYLLILSACLLMIYRCYCYVFQVACTVLFLCIFVLDRQGIESATLELLGIGLLGLGIGSVPIENIKQFIGRPHWLILAYMCYAVAVNVWNVVYPLEVVGVCLNLMLIYRLSTFMESHSKIGRQMMRLGRYSLFGYIVQIVILQLLHSSLHGTSSRVWIPIVALLAGGALTVAAVGWLDRARANAAIVNKFYVYVFS
jgi:peptidoglycan/LPS O-acetylase OafA/YrhL